MSIRQIEGEEILPGGYQMIPKIGIGNACKQVVQQDALVSGVGAVCRYGTKEACFCRNRGGE